MTKSTRAKVLLFLVAALVASIALTSTAISPREECEAAGGTYEKVRGTQTCTFTTTPGNNQGGVTKEETDSQKGSSRSSHPEETSTCVNNNGGLHCPPGQQG